MDSSSDRLRALRELVATLRGPNGCPWDREQSIEDIRGYLLEEAHEVAAAIDSGVWPDISGELGDLLFQIVFVAQIAGESNEFELDDVIDEIVEKMIERHPHVFGSESLESAEAVHRAWERRKADLRDLDESVLAGVPDSLPSLLAAYRMSQKAAGVGFDWASSEQVLGKLSEEIEELRQALERQDTADNTRAIREELGDILFTVANLARKLDQDPEAALAAANRKFRRRFRRMEAELVAKQRSIATASNRELNDLWEAGKNTERDQDDPA